MPDTILIIDFGSQVTQLIARRLREKSIYTEILPSSVLGTTDMAMRLADVKGVVLSGGPNSVTQTDTPRAPEELFDADIPLLGICYGQQTICAQLGGKVEDVLFVSGAQCLKYSIMGPPVIIPEVAKTIHGDGS